MSQLQVTGEAKIRDIQGPVVANSGVITALDGAASQYVRGDGTLADFPTSSGGGSSVSYYLNSSVSQGTIGGVAYRELSKEPIIGAGTDIAISANGYVANYLTDANDPDVILVPGGNFNCEFYFSVNNETGNPNFYAELYKYDGTTFTLLGTSAGVPESINQGTTIAPYYFAIPVATAALALTDRLAIRIYVNVDGRTVTLHTENGHLCQVVTTLSKGMVSLNNLTDQSQFITTGTSGTNFNIVSSGDTHTFNLPIASATNTGKLSSTDWSTFNGKVPYTGATADVDLGAFTLSAGATSSNIVYANGSGSSSGMLYLKKGTIAANYTGYNGIYATSTSYGLIADTGSAYKLGLFSLASLTDNTARTFTLPDISGTLALLEGTQTFSGAKTFSLDILVNGLTIGRGAGSISTNTVVGSSALSANTTGYGNTSIGLNNLIANTTGFFNVAIGASSLISNTTGTYNAALGTSSLYNNTTGSNNTAVGQQAGESNTTGSNNTYIGRGSGYGIETGSNNTIIGAYTGTAALANNIVLADGAGNVRYRYDGTNNNLYGNVNFSSTIGNGTYTYTLPSATGTLALTSNLSSYVPYSGATTNLDLGNNHYLGGSILLKQGIGSVSATGYFSLSGSTGSGVGSLILGLGSGTTSSMNFPNSSNYTYTFPASSGTIALTSNLSAYLPLTGGTLTGALSGTSATFSGSIDATVANLSSGLKVTGSSIPSGTGAEIVYSSGKGLFLTFNRGTSTYLPTEIDGSTVTLSISGTPKLSIASTGAATFSSSVDIGQSATIRGFTGTTGAGMFLAYGSAGAGVGSIFTYNYGTSTYGPTILDGSYVALYNSGTERMRITGGNVGIGTSSPAYKLHVQDNTNAGTIALGNLSYPGLLYSDAGSGEFRIDNRSSSFGYITFYPNGQTTIGNERMRITSGGNVLIGTTTDAGYKLDVNGTGRFSDNLLISKAAALSILTIKSSSSTTGLWLYLNGLNATLSNQDNGSLAFQTNGTDRLTIASTGAATFSSNLGVKTSGRNESFSVEHTLGNNSAAFIYTNAIASGQSYGLTVYAGTNASDRSFLVANQGGANPYLYVRGDGNVGIGTSSPAGKLMIYSPSGGGDLFQNIVSSSGGATKVGINFSPAFLENFPSLYPAQSSIYAVDDNYSANLIFATKVAGAVTNALTERMRITSGGELYWNLTGASGGSLNGGGVLFRNNSGKYVQISTGVTTDTGLIYFYKSDGAGSVTNTGSIATSGNSTAYNTTSDYRIKEDFKQINGLEKVSAIKVYDFKFKGIDNRMDGVIAHELAEVLPYAVSGEKDAVDDEGNIKPQAVDYSKIVPILVKSIQELEARIKQLENK